MLKKAWIVFFFALCARADLTVEQKLADFYQIAALYGKHYAPYEWKRILRNYDPLDLRAWGDRIRATRDDLDYLDVVVDYLARLNDAHVSISFPSAFSASLPITVDIYDGKVLIDSINRAQLAAFAYPFQVGDELVEFDGLPVEEWIARFEKYSTSANPRSTRRGAAGRIVSRPQSRMPRAHELPDDATLVVRRASTGNLETYLIAWNKVGTPLLTLGKFPSPFFSVRQAAADPADPDAPPPDPAPQPDYLAPLRMLGNERVDTDHFSVLNYGSRTPIFGIPTGFVQRLGRFSGEFFYSGTFQSGGLRIGFIRIPSFSPPDPDLAFFQFRNEMLFFEQNTDGLVVDDMRNPGGSATFRTWLLQLLFAAPFRTIGYEIRATAYWHVSISSALASAVVTGAPQLLIDQYTVILNDIESALRENRGMTGPLPISGSSLDVVPVSGAYTKPLIVLVDEYSASAGDAFAATIQDNARGPLFGYRTMGAGGTVVTFFGGPYSEASPRVTIGLMSRKNPVVTDDFPTAPYIENIGVRPDIVEDYMTRDNLMNAGRDFVAKFSAAIVAEIRKQRGQ